MKQDVNNARHYTAANGKIFVRKEDSVRLGNEIYLSETDLISNYSESKMTEKELAEIEKIKAMEAELKSHSKNKH